MSNSTSVFTYLEVPEECQDLLPILDVNTPYFSSMMKKIMRKIDRGHTQIRRSIKKPDDNGHLEPSGYEIVGTFEDTPRDLLLACLPNADGPAELYRFPFVRLTVKKVNELTPENNPSTTSPNVPFLTSLDATLKNMVERIDQLSATVSTLTAPKPTRSRRSVAGTTPAAKKPTVDDPAKVCPVEVMKAPTTTPRTRPKGRSMGSMPASTPIQAPSITQAQLTPNQTFSNHLDDTINDVLSCIRRGKDERLFNTLRTKFLDNLSALPPPSAQIVDAPAAIASPVPSGDTNVAALPLSPSHHHKTHKKRILSSPGMVSSQMSTSSASPATKMRFKPIATNCQANDFLQHTSPDLLAGQDVDDEMNHLSDLMLMTNEDEEGKHHKKHKSGRSKRQRVQNDSVDHLSSFHSMVY